MLADGIGSLLEETPILGITVAFIDIFPAWSQLQSIAQQLLSVLEFLLVEANEAEARHDVRVARRTAEKLIELCFGIGVPLGADHGLRHRKHGRAVLRT